MRDALPTQDRLTQIRRSHASARPSAENPAWCHTHADLTFALAEIDRLCAVLARTEQRLFALASGIEGELQRSSVKRAGALHG